MGLTAWCCVDCVGLQFILLNYLCALAQMRGVAMQQQDYNSAQLIAQVICQVIGWLTRFAKGASICCHRKTWLSGATCGRTLFFPGELQAQLHGTEENVNLCAPGASEDQDAGP